MAIGLNAVIFLKFLKAGDQFSQSGTEKPFLVKKSSLENYRLAIAQFEQHCLVYGLYLSKFISLPTPRK